MDDELLLFGDAEVSVGAAVNAQTVISIRDAQRKSLPRELPVDSVEWEAAALEFAKDTDRVSTGESNQSYC
ncbi:hypothetical protein [Caballeronia sordidicola]|nr:hypothetical protein [Caballeronia sordidicola]AME27172.1 hypothetical protein AXG89_24990 [Burkholderia sp. PAMC 26561]AME27679.1 hypothetical protein AXG89_27705 [Burkholderia sp. PAMC 26561]